MERGGTGVSKRFQARENTRQRKKGDMTTEKEEREMFPERFCLGPRSFLTEVRHQNRWIQGTMESFTSGVIHLCIYLFK